MADGSFVEGQCDATDDEGAAFRQAMQIVANAATNRVHEKSGSKAAALQIN
jgi:hypothetical protein